MNKRLLWIPPIGFLGAFIGSLLIHSNQWQVQIHLPADKAISSDDADTLAKATEPKLPGRHWTQAEWDACLKSVVCAKAANRVFTEAAKPLYPVIAIEK